MIRLEPRPTGSKPATAWGAPDFAFETREPRTLAAHGFADEVCWLQIPAELRIPVKSPVTVMCVCSKCNNGWMSNLENHVKPLLRSLMSDIALTIDMEQQSALSIWAAKVAIVTEATTQRGIARLLL